MKLYISPTNQVNNTYATGNTNERAQCAKIAQAVGKELANYDVNYKVGDETQKMWITNSSGKLTGGRIKDAVDWKADWYIEIHTNATGLPNSTGVGAMTLIRMLPDRQALGKVMVEALNAICPYKANRGGVIDGYDKKQYGAVRYPENHGVKALMIEVNYHDYAPVAKWIIDNTTKIGQTIAQTLAKQFGLKKKQANAEKPATPPKGDNSMAELWTINAGTEIKKEPPTEIEKSGVYTIVEKRGNWGKLKSGAGWIDLRLARKK